MGYKKWNRGKVFLGHKEGVFYVAVTPNGNYIVSGSWGWNL